MGQNANDRGELLHASQLGFDVAVVLVVDAGGIAIESLLLRAVPVRVEARRMSDDEKESAARNSWIFERSEKSAKFWNHLESSKALCMF